MATMVGNDGNVAVGNIAIAQVRTFTVEMTADTIETTIMGQDSRTFLKGLSQFSGSADIYFDPTEFNSGVATFNPTHSTSVVGLGGVLVKFYLDQDASADIAFQGNCIITGYTVNSSMDGLVEASITFQGTGGTTFSTTGNV
jgi:predicted secreted protein